MNKERTNFGEYKETNNIQEKYKPTLPKDGTQINFV